MESLKDISPSQANYSHSYEIGDCKNPEILDFKILNLETPSPLFLTNTKHLSSLTSESCGALTVDLLTSNIQRSPPLMSGVFDNGEPELASPVSGSLPLLDDLDLLWPLPDVNPPLPTPAAEQLPAADEGFALAPNQLLNELLSQMPDPSLLDDVTPEDISFADTTLDAVEFSGDTSQDVTTTDVTLPDATTDDVTGPEALVTYTTLVVPEPVAPLKRSHSRSAIAGASDHAQYASKRRRRAEPTREVRELAAAEGIAIAEDDDSFVTPEAAQGSPYRQRRDKNNAASRVSRAKRRERQQELEVRQRTLEADNAVLKVKVEEMEALATRMKQELVRFMSRR